MTRTTKSPKQRAEEALAVAERRVERLVERQRALAAEYQAIGDLVRDAVTRRNYLAADPARSDDPDSDETPQGDG